MNSIKFIKMHGLGNDFVIIDTRNQPLDLSKAQICYLTDRQLGVGCDQLVILEESDAADVFVRFFNPDGSESAACGNASRCVADREMLALNTDAVALETAAGILECKRSVDSLVSVYMGVARCQWDEIPLSHAQDTAALPIARGAYQLPVAVNLGNPHAVFFVENVDEADVQGVGASVEVDPLFPERTNVEFVEIIDPSCIKLRVWERGAGETQACGSGACAAAIAAYEHHDCEAQMEVCLPGGSLYIAVDDERNVVMTGPAAYVFSGEIQL